MGRPQDYDPIAETYAAHRWPLPWILAPLAERVAGLPPAAVVVVAGCGTGDYTGALLEAHPDRRYFGFDIADYARYFTEAHRVLKPGGNLLVFTDDEDDIRARGFSTYFPETVPVNLGRYPRIDDLVAVARAAGLQGGPAGKARGELPFEGRLLGMLRERAASELRLIPDEAHRAGMARIEAAAARGERWISQISLLSFGKDGPEDDAAGGMRESTTGTKARRSRSP
jgi:SAM-dependent methyltransferase